MGDFVNGFATKIIAFSISVIVISVNFAFVYFYVRSSISSSVLAYLLLVVYFAFYLLFLFYLLGTYLAVLGFEFVLEVPYVGKYFKESDYNEYRYSWLDVIVLSESERPKEESDEEEDEDDSQHSEHDKLMSQVIINQST